MPDRGIDHIVICTRDLEAARARYAALGFTLTPRAEHPFGTANALVQLQGNFIELLTVADEGRFPPEIPGEFSFPAFNRDYLARREGLSMLVFQGSDARADQAEFAAKGLDTYPPFDFSRQATLPGGERVTVAFSLAFVTHAAMPEAAFFTCQQHAPEYFWKPEFQRHANTALRIDEAVMAAEDPDAYGDFFAALQGADAVLADEGRLTVETALGRVVLLDPPRLAERFPDMAFAASPAVPRFVACGIAVADLKHCADTLDEGGVPYRAEAGRLLVNPKEAFGVALAFTAA